ncbi:hypothetical protein HID58_032613 [Brassica napus]|uniref:Uncharacterized protein n=2 Tax=Brassica TaxID=3705 RepID=A0ABQ8BXR3_BRANA|nr:uncharacterized protein LOC106447126 [Brassica napus]KAH0909292.1 hypothetical protein HID58_032613 [Brassica napus]CAG7860861.1 unnamed protein product [Brassica rapa]VDC59278.1 unnamed protein product [Brassica rapa]
MTKWSVVMMIVVLVIATMEREAEGSVCLFNCLKKCRHKDPSVRRYCICECVFLCTIDFKSPQGNQLAERKSFYQALNQTCGQTPNAPSPSPQMKTSFSKEILAREDVHG